MLEDAASAQGEFSGISSDMAAAVSAGMKKYKKYYELMDSQDAYYIALILDPRFKTLLLEKELGQVTAPKVIGTVKETLHTRYPSKQSPDLPATKTDQGTKRQNLEARVLQKLQPQVLQRSDIDRFFEEGVVIVDESVTKQEDWLFSWWNMHKDEYPRIAAAARHYLAFPAAEVAVERLFSRGRDLIGLRRLHIVERSKRAGSTPDWHGKTKWISLSNQGGRHGSVCMWTRTVEHFSFDVGSGLHTGRNCCNVPTPTEETCPS